MTDSIKQIDEFIKTLKPLDLILFQGNTPFSKLILNGSKLIKGDGAFSHCGLVVNKDLCPFIKGSKVSSELLLMEVTVSILDKSVNLETGHFSLGAQIRDIEDVFVETIEKGYGIAVAHLKENPYLIAKESNDEKTIQHIQEVMNKEYNNYFADDKTIYDLNIFSLLGTIFPSLRTIRDVVDNYFKNIEQNHPWLFCSELICIIYRDLDIIKEPIDTQNYLPVDFTNPTEVNIVNSVMQLPPIYLKNIGSPTKESAIKYFVGIFIGFIEGCRKIINKIKLLCKK